MAGVEDIITQVGWNSDSNRVKVELEDLSNDINEGMFTNKHECTVCKRAFSSKSKLARHKKGVHEKIKDYKCDKCSYACSQGPNSIEIF